METKIVYKQFLKKRKGTSAAARIRKELEKSSSNLKGEKER